VRQVFNISALYAVSLWSGRRHTASGVADAILGGWDAAAS